MYENVHWLDPTLISNHRWAVDKLIINISL